MELDECYPLFGSGQMLREFLCDVGLARARRPLEDDLLLVFEQGLDALEEVDRDVQFSGEGPEVVGWRRWERE